jgi:tRNA (guanine37-N1)-methyltransferase
MAQDRRVVLGRVVGAHGIRGEIRVQILGDGPENLMAISRVALGAGPDDAAAEIREVEASGRGRPGEVRLRLRGIADRSAAESLRGRLVLADAAQLPKLPPGEYYWYELIGCRVQDVGGHALGTIREIWETGAHDVLVVEGDDGARRLLPATHELFEEVDTAGRRVVVSGIPGLYEAADAGRSAKALRIDVITIFPDLFGPFLEQATVGIARRQAAVEIELHDLRSWTRDRHRSVDDAPYGGGPGMVMKPEPLVEAIESLVGAKAAGREAWVVLLSPQGRRLSQGDLETLASRPRLVLVCGRYEGIDQRAIDLAVDEEVSIGDYVLSGGEVPAMVLMEGVVRLLPGVLGNPESAGSDSFQHGVLEGPQYTRPAVFRGHEVPEVLRSGDHAEVARWRAERARERTKARRPDLLSGARGGDE